MLIEFEDPMALWEDPTPLPTLLPPRAAPRILLPPRPEIQRFAVSEGAERRVGIGLLTVGILALVTWIVLGAASSR